MKRFFTFLILVLTLIMLCSCNLLTPAHEHTFETEWNYDENYHWHDATCEHKSEISNYGKHTYLEDTCLVCGYKVSKETPEEPVEPATKTYSYMFDSTKFSTNGTVDLGGVEWTLSGDGGYWGYDSSNAKGQQFGSGNKPFKSLKLISEIEFKGVNSLTIETSGASQISGSFTVSVGDNKSASTTLTSTSTEYLFTFNSVDGKVAFDYTQTSSKAIYIKKIIIVCSDYDGYVPDDSSDSVDITTKVTKSEGVVTIPFGVIIADDEYVIYLNDTTKVKIKWTGFAENGQYSEFGVLGGQSITFTVEGDDYVLYSLSANVYGTYDNMKLYQGKDASGILKTASTSEITNGVAYTYVVEDAEDLYFINSSSNFTVWFYSLSFTYGVEGGSTLKPSEPTDPETPEDPDTPTNPDLEDYYESMVGHLDSTFKETLHTLLKSTHTTKNTYANVWTILQDADEDPNNQNNIICIYTGQSIPKSDRDGASSSSIVWNREHSWAKSHGFNNQNYYAYTDCHHLFASEKTINGIRDNKDFGEVSNGSSDKYGNSWNSTYFEPRDEVKGDIARALMYMVVRYDDANELDLELVNHSTGSSDKNGELGLLETLVKWHYEDPVSEKEKNRNNVVQSYQGNRNPFIDHPEWVAVLYPEYAQSSSIYSEEDLQIHFLELGNRYAGDSVYIKAGDTDILIDAGSRKASSTVIDNYLKTHGVADGKLEYVIATHAHEDHIAGFVGTSNKGIFDLYDCDTIIDYAYKNTSSQISKDYENKRDALVATGTKHYTALDCVTGANGGKKEFVINDKISFEILDQKFYHQKSSDENNHSVCVLLKYGENRFLFTGDLEEDGEKSLVELNNLPHCRLFKGGHHGSKTSSNEILLSEITPEVVCVCCCAGSNEYTDATDNMFPTQDFINRVAKYTDKIYVTTLAIYEVATKGGEEYLKAVDFASMNGNITVTINAVNEIKVNCSNNNTILKDSEWFNTIITLNGITRPMRTWPAYGV